MGFLISAIASFLNLLEILIVIDSITTWFFKPRSNQLSRIIGIIVDPILIPCTKIQSRVIKNLPINFSPVIAIILIEFCKAILNMIFKL